jgi:penicillin-binding protein 2
MFKIFKGLKNKKIKTWVEEELEPQEVLLDALSQRNELFYEKKFEVALARKVLNSFCFFSFALLLVLLVKSFQLQILENKEFFVLAQKNYQRIYYERPNRGVIYDQKMEQLVFNDSSFDLVLDKKEFSRTEEQRKIVLDKISKTLSLNQNDLSKMIEQGNEDRVLIFENLDLETLAILESRLEELPGFSIEENIKRSYLEGPIFSHVIGYVGRVEKNELSLDPDYTLLDYIGKTGLERSYESVLKGVKGKTVVWRDVFSKELLKEKISDPKPGNSLVLWLDADLQEKATQALKDSLVRVNARAGSVVVMDPQTGGILALVSLPSFDNNLFFKRLSQEEWQRVLIGSAHPLWNRAISATYPSGSTIKPLVAVGALEEKIITPDKQLFCPGQIEVPNPWFPDQPWIFRDWKVHGWTDLRKAIAESCNVYFYTIGGGFKDIKGLGETKIKHYLNLFGWGRLTGIDLPGEKRGLIPDKEWKKQYFKEKNERIWYPGDTYNLSIGQGYLSVTPLQVVTSFAALANGGKLVKPMLVKQIIDQNKEVVKSFEPQIVRENFVETENIKVVREGMREAVIYGSSVILNDLPIKVAAKTGTAQTGRKDYYHNWVTVFAPYDDPEIVLTVVVENVPKEQVAALPVAKEILNWYFSNRE